MLTAPTIVRTPKPGARLRQVAVVLVAPGGPGDVEVGPRHVAQELLEKEAAVIAPP